MRVSSCFHTYVWYILNHSWSYGLYSYGPRSYGLHSHGLYNCALYRYGPCSYSLRSYGLYSSWPKLLWPYLHVVDLEIFIEGEAVRYPVFF